jgi:PmbA protein
MDGAALLTRAERMVEKARAQAPAEVEFYLEEGHGLDVELENDALAATSYGRSAGGSVRVVHDGRVGFAYFTRDTDASAAFDQALRQSRHAPALGYHLPSAQRPSALPGRWDDSVAALDPDAVLSMARDMLSARKETAPNAVLSGGAVSLEAGAWAIASSQGVGAWDRSTGASAMASLVLSEGGRAISAGEHKSSHKLDVDCRSVTAGAARKVLDLRNPRAVEKGGRFDVILGPEATAELVVDLAVSAATGDDARRGRTVWSGKLGEPVASVRFALHDDPFHKGAIGAAPMDGEGAPTNRLAIIEGGVLQNFLYDSFDAHRHHAASTRSAVRSDFKSRPATGTHHLVASSSGARPLAALIGGVDDGFLVDSILGAHTANATTGEFSVTSPNVWRIRKGAIAGAASEIAISGTLADALARLDGTSKEAKAMDGMSMPHVCLRGMDVSV